MYGLVNQGIKDLVLSRFGDSSWEKLCEEARSPIDFISMDYYDDQITYRLVGAASKLLQIPAESILSEFGKYWVHYTAKEGYGPIMDLFGSDFKSCLQNLNHLHARMGMTMPQLNPPSFHFSEIDEKTFDVSYHSNRKGLGPMVTGLLEGLARKFNHKIEVKVQDAVNGENTIVFRIRITGEL